MPQTDTKLMQIREFSTRSRLTQKALRLYDALGLLEPAQVDAQSGYRYYSVDQLEKAKMIALLRQLEMPLNRIARVLELSGVAAAQEVSAYWREVERDVKEKRGLLLYIEQKLNPKTRKEESMFEVNTRNVEARKIVVIGKVCFQPELDKFIKNSIHRLMTQVPAQNAALSGAPFVVYHGKVDADSDALVEVCFPFTGHLEPVDDISIRLEPAHEEAYVTMTKPQLEFPDILQGYDAVDRWLSSQGKVCTLSPREIYFGDWDNISNTDPAFDIAYPF